VLAVQGTRGIGKADMKLNDATPKIEVDPETYEVRADGELLTCEPAEELPLAQRYFLLNILASASTSLPHRLRRRCCSERHASRSFPTASGWRRR
jgi:hypothetical protein